MKRKGKRSAVKSRDWVKDKKERQRRQGREVRPDSKYTGRKRGPKYVIIMFIISCFMFIMFILLTNGFWYLHSASGFDVLVVLVLEMFRVFYNYKVKNQGCSVPLRLQICSLNGLGLLLFQTLHIENGDNTIHI